MAWKALRNLNGYTLDLFYSGGQVIENPNAVQDNSPVTFGNTPVSKSSLPASTGELWFNITNNLAINFCFNYVGDSSFSTNTAHCWIYLNNQASPGYWTGGFGCGGNYPRYVAYSIFIDDENQKACIVWRHHFKYRWGQPGALYDNDSKERSRSEYDTAMYAEIKSVMVMTSNGGGASHIAKVTGQLSTLSSNLSDILIVSGGGGGGMIIGTTEYDGADAGGISGSGSNSGNQSTGYAFGQGESSITTSGGGSGLYGGYKATPAGTYTLDSVIKTRDMTHYQATAGDDINALSNYFGTNYVLITRSERAAISDLTYSNIQGGYITLPVDGASISNRIKFYIPITKLLNVTEAKLAGISQYGNGSFYIGVAKVVNNEMVIITDSTMNCNTNTYTFTTFSLENETIDYIVFSGGYCTGNYYCIATYIEFTKEY